MNISTLMDDVLDASAELFDPADDGQPSGMDMGGHLRYPDDPERVLVRALTRLRDYLDDLLASAGSGGIEWDAEFDPPPADQGA